MKIELAVDKIKSVFEIAEKFSGNANIETYMNYVHIKMVQGEKKAIATTSDGNYSFSSPFEILDVTSDPGDKNEFLIPIKPFMALIKKMPQNEFTVIAEPSSIKVKGKKFKYSLPVKSNMDFGFLACGSIQNSMKVNSKDLSGAFDRVAFAASTKGDKHNLQAIYLKMEKDYTDMVTTDRSRLAYKVFDNKNFIQSDKLTDVLIPISVVPNIMPLVKNDDGELEFKIFDNVIQFHFSNGFIVTSRKIDEEYPDYSRIVQLNMNEHEIIISRKDLANSLDRLAQMADMKVVNFNFTKSQLVLKIKEADKGEGEEVLEIQNKDKCEKIVSYSAEMVLGALNAIQTDEIVFKISDDAKKPLGIKEYNGDNNYICVIMPVTMT